VKSIPVNLATEDELSEITLYKVLSEIDRYVIGTAYRLGGFGYLRRTIHGWNSAAKGVPFIVLTDLDTAECPARLINDWLPTENIRIFCFGSQFVRLSHGSLRTRRTCPTSLSLGFQSLQRIQTRFRIRRPCLWTLPANHAPRRFATASSRERAVRRSRARTTMGASLPLLGSAGMSTLQREILRA
jgi:hypothetical protein